MSLANLPGPLLAEVVRWLYPRMDRQVMGWHRYASSYFASCEHDAKAALQCFSPLSKALHALVRQTPEMYFQVNDLDCEYSKPTYEPALALGCSRSVVDGHIASLLASSFRMTAAQLLLIDLRATCVRAESAITIFKTCPLLEELDVGECKKLSVLELARRLEEVPRESLVVEHLQKIEICGSGDGDSWVGYRPKLR